MAIHLPPTLNAKRREYPRQNIMNESNQLMVDDILAELQSQIGDQACTIAILKAENKMLKKQLDNAQTQGGDGND